MVTRFPTVVLTLVFIVVEVRCLKCYVCTNCSDVHKPGSTVEEKNNCSACVIEDKFDYTKYLKTDRSCAKCPDNKLAMSNNDRSFYHCCYADLCLGQEREGLSEIKRTAKINVKHETTIVDTSGRVSSEEGKVKKSEKPKLAKEVEVQSMEHSSDTSTKHSKSSSTATDHSSGLSPKRSMPPSGTADSTIANPNKATGGKEEIPERTNKTLDKSMESSSPAKFHKRVWCLVFFVYVICDLVVCSN